MLYQNMLFKSKELAKKIILLEQEISNLPEGKICCVHDKNRIKWMHKKEDKYIYISKKERILAEQLALKKQYIQFHKQYTGEKYAVDLYLKHHREDNKELQKMLSDPAYQELLRPYFKPESDELVDWINTPYEKNQNYPEKLIYRTSSGNMVRSKSEVLIDMYLYTNRIPFRYECALPLGESVVYPDFTIRHPITGKTYYWEHFGMVDNPVYAKKAISKMELYMSHQIYPDIQLITTYETKEFPLVPETIEFNIKRFFSYENQLARK